jgi:signal transduction histidine kinase
MPKDGEEQQLADSAVEEEQDSDSALTIPNLGPESLGKTLVEPLTARKISIDGFVGSHYLGFSLAFSVLLVTSGVLFVVSSISTFYPSPVIPSPFTGKMAFGVIGVLLLVGAVFLNQFVFKALKKERQIRIKAEQFAREAQLLQDILAHDIRNYNQVSRLSAELIDEEFARNPLAQQLVTQLLSSIDSSTLLVERAKLLGKVISGSNLEQLHPVDLVESIRRSMELVTNAHPERKVVAALKVGSQSIAPLPTISYTDIGPVEVRADVLLDEVFVNLFANSIKYTEEYETFTGIELEKVRDQKLKKDCWKISIADTGKGIPDSLKPSLFSRYLEGAKGSGLGLSIVHALVVGRYGGRIEIKDRVQNVSHKGTLIEMYLIAA